MVETVTAVEFYQAPLELAAFVVGWSVAMLTGLLFRSLIA